MGQGKQSSVTVKLICLVVLCIVSVSCDNPSASTKGKVIEIDPSSVEYLANSFDQVLLFFLQERNEEMEIIYEEFVKDLNESFSTDHTLYAITYLNKDDKNKLEKFGKSQGWRIITKRNHYALDFNNDIHQFQHLKKFYTHHVHPVLPIFISDQFESVGTEYFVAMEYSNLEALSAYVKVYPKLYDFLKLFNVRAVAVQSEKNETKVHIYKQSNTQKPFATYANDLNNTDELIDFINVQTLPLLTSLNDENYVRIFGSFLDTQLLLIYDEKNQNSSEINAVREQLKQVATFNREEELKYQRILFAEATTQFLGKYFDDAIKNLHNEKDELFNYRIVLTKTDYGNFQLRRFNFETEEHGQPNKENIIQFIEDVRMKKIDSEYESEPVPTEKEQQRRVLRKIVGNSFISEIYEKPDQSIIVLFVDSKQPETYKEIQAVFENFTTTYKKALEGKVVSAIFDLAKNQHKLLSIKTAPMLSLFERTNKKSPKNFRGYPKVESIKNWINYEIKDFTIPQNFGQEILPLGAPDTSSSQNTQTKSQQL